MKFFQLTLVFAVFTMLTACSNDAKKKTIEDNQLAKTEQSKLKQPQKEPAKIEKSNLPKKMEQTSRKSFSDAAGFNQLTKVKPSTQYFIGTVNKQKPKGNEAIMVNGPRFTMTGWAIDSKASQVAGGVYVVINDKPFLAKYGDPRPDVAKALKNPALVNTGFSLNIPSGAIGKGQYELSIHVVSTDKNTIFADNKNIKTVIYIK